MSSVSASFSNESGKAAEPYRNIVRLPCLPPARSALYPHLLIDCVLRDIAFLALSPNYRRRRRRLHQQSSSRVHFGQRPFPGLLSGLDRSCRRRYRYLHRHNFARDFGRRPFPDPFLTCCLSHGIVVADTVIVCINKILTTAFL